ncbi:MAG: tRNA (adenosine(37)-N6)-dimethylallyltransferase MiaA [Chryseobacterium sp.]|nr:tRNA (adenosine(37)-N6)-dimethylallyltransferase MiaA [Chryseobacterium sp.]
MLNASQRPIKIIALSEIFQEIYAVKTLISIIGTTGIGKTKLAIQLAKHFRTEIISCDSRQFFREMKIGTATPSLEELAEVPHHFIGQLSVQDYYSIGQFEKEADQKIAELFQMNDVVILVGGSMMYEKAVIRGLNDLPQANDDHQKKLTGIWENHGIEALRNLLEALDPQYYAMVDRNNSRRLLRAIDIIWQTGKTYTENIAAQVKQKKFQVVRIGIEAPREIIYGKINHRVDVMMDDGLLQEAQQLMNFRNLVALQTVGYTELFRYFDGEWTLDFAIEEIKKNSRRFAKRQLTWYRKEEDIHWVNFQNSLEESLSLLQGLNIQ